VYFLRPQYGFLLVFRTTLYQARYLEHETGVGLSHSKGSGDGDLKIARKSIQKVSKKWTLTTLWVFWGHCRARNYEVDSLLDHVRLLAGTNQFNPIKKNQKIGRKVRVFCNYARIVRRCINERIVRCRACRTF